MVRRPRQNRLIVGGGQTEILRSHDIEITVYPEQRAECRY